MLARGVTLLDNWMYVHRGTAPDLLYWVFVTDLG